MYDILIQNGNIIDGTGSPAMKAQVAIQDGKIVKIARKIDGEAKTVIDAAGKVITPGFIDSHSHSDNQFSSVPLQTEKIEQGTTMEYEANTKKHVQITDKRIFPILL